MTHSIQSILFATDFSDCAREAQRHAGEWAAAFGARLHVAHVVELPPGMDPEQPVNKMYVEERRKSADAELVEALAGLERAGIRAQGRIEAGIPSQQLTEIAGALGSDLLVLGTRGLTGLNHLLIGSTAERTVRTAPCPVLTVRTPAGAEAGRGPGQPRGIRRILAPLDFSDCSLDALELAVSVAKVFGAALTIQHVLEPVSFGLDFTLRQVEERRQARIRVESWLSQLGTALQSQGLRVDHAVAGGNPADAILLAHRRDQRCDLIVMGTHGRRGVSHLVSGSVAEHVLRHAECPVLTVKSPKFRPGHQPVLAEHRGRLPIRVSAEQA